MGVPPNHPFIDGKFHHKPSSYWGTHNCGNIRMGKEIKTCPTSSLIPKTQGVSRGRHHGQWELGTPRNLNEQCRSMVT